MPTPKRLTILTRMALAGFFFVGHLAFSDLTPQAARFRLVGPRQAPDYQAPNSKSTFQIYSDQGVWDIGLDHFQQFLQTYRHSYHSTSAAEILSGALDPRKSELLIMPGGESWEYLSSLGSAGAEKIRHFVASGGSYLGICAGSFYAVSHREGGHTTGAYGIGLLEGVAYDGTDLETAPFIEGMLDFDLVPGSLLAFFGVKTRAALFGGPSFRYAASEGSKKQVQVLGRFPQSGEPAMITFRYGQGRVFLSAPHLEVEENQTDWGPEFHDPDSEWPLLDRVIDFLTHKI